MSAQSAAVITPFLASAAFVTLNELGDKTQLLAAAMAARYSFGKVILGVLIATLLNHGLAVAIGSLLASVPGWSGWVSFISALLFIVFGLWALRPDRAGGGADDVRQEAGGVAAVTSAFFLAEMGDKTQLATITLAAQYSSAPLLVLAGSTAGMLIADSAGVAAGTLLHRRLPDAALRLIAACAFVLFGLAGLWSSLGSLFCMGGAARAGIVAAAGLLSLPLGFIILRREKRRE
jgi:putative Ca2+/H+ antiporter (TMEM165/GDT1 family)